MSSRRREVFPRKPCIAHWIIAGYHGYDSVKSQQRPTRYKQETLTLLLLHLLHHITPQILMTAVVCHLPAPIMFLAWKWNKQSWRLFLII